MPDEPRAPSFRAGRRAARARIAFDLVRSLLRPVRDPAGPAPGVTQRRALRPGPRTPAASEPLRLLSWNVHRGYDLAVLAPSLAALVRDRRPHLLLLQEVPVVPDGPFWELGEVAEALAGYHLVFAPMHRVLHLSCYYPYSASGQLTASWQPPSDVTVAPLPVVTHPKLGPAHRVARLALMTSYGVDSTSVRLAHLHLENTTGPGGRTLQAEHSLAAATAFPADVVVIAGDLNTFFVPFEGVATLLRRAGFTQAPRPRPLVPDVDWFFARGARISATRLPTRGSDHRPVLAELRLDRKS